MGYQCPAAHWLFINSDKIMTFNNFGSQRERMVKTQIIGRKIEDLHTLDAMLKVPREKFISERYHSQAYDDRPLPIDEEQTVSQPFMVALMTQSLQLQGEETVLEIGTGSGYQTAILAEIAAQVYSIERLPALAHKARETLKDLGYENITVMAGDGSRGDPEHAPFDAIIVTAGSPGVPLPLKEQLAEDGRLVIPVGSRYTQELKRITRRGDSFFMENLGGCIFVPLIGTEGWEQNESM